VSIASLCVSLSLSSASIPFRTLEPMQTGSWCPRGAQSSEHSAPLSIEGTESHNPPFPKPSSATNIPYLTWKMGWLSSTSFSIKWDYNVSSGGGGERLCMKIKRNNIHIHASHLVGTQ
jgi:hypothetical protein